MEANKGEEKEMRQNVLSREAAEDRLLRNGVNIEGRTISLPVKGIGLSCWAAVDCLVNRHKYTIKKGE
jgi:hypothetical protein